MYSHIYRNILFPFYETVLKGRNTLKYADYLERSQWHSQKKLKEIQWESLQILLKHAYVNVPFYRERFERLGIYPHDIKSPEDMNRLPFLTKQDIRDNQEKLVASNYRNKKIYATATGGSTGAPVHIKLDHRNYEWRQAATKRVYRWADYHDGDKAAFIWGSSVGKKSLRERLKHDVDEWFKRHRIYNSFHFTKEMLPHYLREINAYRPKIIVAYTTPLYNLAKFARENGRRVWSPKAIIIGAEKLFPYQRETIEDVFSCQVFETYGCREVTSIAGECEVHDGMHINMENIYLEVVRGSKTAVAGEAGEIVLTDLTNYCMPLIRYKNEDIGALYERKCACGRGLMLLEKVHGRILDTIQTPDGKLIPGEFFPHLMKEFEEIEKFQVFQEDLDKLCIKIMMREDISKEQFDFMQGEIHKVMGDNVDVDFQFVEDIPVTQTGKFRVVHSNVPIDFGE